MSQLLNYSAWSKIAYKIAFNKVNEDLIDWPYVFNSDKKTNHQLGLLNFDFSELEEIEPWRINNFEKRKNFKDFYYLIDTILCHSSDEKFSLSYQLLKKYITNPKILYNHIDSDVRKAQLFKKQVGRDIHKMRAFVRFNKAVKSGEDYYIAYHKPDHFILKKNAKFFQNRFNTMKWIIFTPDAVLAWNGETSFYKEGGFSPKKFPKDPFVNLWKTYFANIFNPARLKIKAMKNEMPIRYWENMPEAELIPELIRDAGKRVSRMNENLRIERPAAQSYISGVAHLKDLENRLEKCKACSLCDLKTKPVPGTGSSSASIMIVGEAPGGHEEKKGQVFVGPAGRFLRESLKKINIDDSFNIYFTNAVKHFNFKVSETGLRIHKTPKPEHVMSCRPWLSKEIEIIKPDKIICLGRTAVNSIFGFVSGLDSLRNNCHSTSFCDQVYVTYHPSRILREKDIYQKNKLTEIFESDLKKAILSNDQYRNRTL